MEKLQYNTYKVAPMVVGYIPRWFTSLQTVLFQVLIVFGVPSAVSSIETNTLNNTPRHYLLAGL